MGTCSRCGNPVEFRYIGGRCIPLHTYGSCVDGGGSRANDYSGFNTSSESTCFCTNCPECGNEVFFIRHNGGSVWIDPPLGPPWYKHSCFETSHVPNAKSSLSIDYKIPVKTIYQENEPRLAIGIVKSTRVDILKRYTDINYETGKQETKSIRLKHNAGFLLGKLCVYDAINAGMWPVEESSYVFAVYKPQQDQKVDLIKCPKCGVNLNPKNLDKHLRQQHGIMPTQS